MSNPTTDQCRFCGGRFTVALKVHEENCEWRTRVENSAADDILNSLGEPKCPVCRGPCLRRPRHADSRW